MIIADVYEYLEGNIVLNIPVHKELPESIQVAGQQLFLKSEFHITLINTGRTAKLIDEVRTRTIELEIINTFKNFIKSHSLEKYNLLKNFRFVQRDSNKTVIALAYVDKLEDFFEELRVKYNKVIPDQPTHVTMYTLVTGKGIGLNSKKVIEQDSDVAEIHELENLKFFKADPVTE